MSLALPRIMVAPNGARLQKSDHPALPMSIGEIVACARACRDCGADGIHAHIRDKKGAHILDAGQYRELMDELESQVPDIAVQVTTEAAGLYSPAQQRELVKALRPAMVSVSVREMLSDEDLPAALDFYSFCRDEAVTVQHILYSTEDLERLVALGVADKDVQLLFVLGSHQGKPAEPADLDPFLATAAEVGFMQPDMADWAVCAFGPQETDCLAYAVQCGGKVRVGFENNRINRDGSIAGSNEERVAEIVTAIGKQKS